MIAAQPLQRLLQSAFDLWCTDAPEIRADCAELAGRRVAVELSDLGLEFGLEPHAAGITVTLGAPVDADARIRARSVDLLRALRGGNGGPLEISGDAELAQRLRGLLRAVRFDPDERLAALIGDVPAHQLGRALRGVAAFGRDSAAALGDMAGEYLHYETRALPTKAEVAAFVAAVDRIRDDVERAAATLARVESRHHG